MTRITLYVSCVHIKISTQLRKGKVNLDNFYYKEFVFIFIGRKPRLVFYVSLRGATIEHDLPMRTQPRSRTGAKTKGWKHRRKWVR